MRNWGSFWLIGFSFGTLEQILLFYHWHSACKKYKFSNHKHKFHAKLLKFCHPRKLNDMKCPKTYVRLCKSYDSKAFHSVILSNIVFFFVLYRFPIKIWDDNFKTLGRAYGSGYTVCYEAWHMREWAWKKNSVA